jgi:hypothetical protein
MTTKKFILTLCCPDDYEKTGADGKIKPLSLPVPNFSSLGSAPVGSLPDHYGAFWCDLLA